MCIPFRAKGGGLTIMFHTFNKMEKVMDLVLAQQSGHTFSHRMHKTVAHAFTLVGSQYAMPKTYQKVKHHFGLHVHMNIPVYTKPVTFSILCMDLDKESHLKPGLMASPDK